MGHPRSQVNFSERLYEEKLDSFAQAKSWHRRLRTLWLLSRLDPVDPTGRAKGPII